MKKIGIYIAYWDSNDKYRYENTILSIKYIKKYINFLSKYNVDAEFKIFDFSEDQVFQEGIWIPYYKGSYKRSEKLNKIIDYCQEDIICIMDSDIIINPKDFNNLKDLMLSSSDKRFYVSKVNDVLDRDCLDIDNVTIDFDNIKSNERNFDPDLGGFFFMETNILKNSELRFNEKFTHWGGEDNYLCYELLMKGYKKILLPIIFNHLPHSSLALETQKTEEYKKQLKLVIDKQKELLEYKKNN